MVPKGAAGCHQLGHPLAGLEEARAELEQGILMALDPIGRDGIPGGVDGFFRESRYLSELGLKIVQGTNAVINLPASAEALKG
jgi:hypothetical protein